MPRNQVFMQRPFQSALSIISNNDLALDLIDPNPHLCFDIYFEVKKQHRGIFS